MIDVNSPIYQQDETNNNIRMTSLYDIQLYSAARNYYYVQANMPMHEIIPGLFLGAHTSADRHCLAQLVDNDIRYIICVRQQPEEHYVRPYFDERDDFTYLTLEIEDRATENIIRFFPQVKKFIDEGIARNCKVLVHGRSGNSRSATLVLAYIMEKFNLSSEEAYKFVKGKRASISPNEGFVAQLTEYEPIYRARQSLNGGEPSSCDSRCQKRKRDTLHESDEYNLVQPPPSPSADHDYDDDERAATLLDFSDNLYKLLLKR